MNEIDNDSGLLELVDIIKEADPEGKIVKLDKEDLEVIEQNLDIDVPQSKSLLQKIIDFLKGNR